MSAIPTPYDRQASFTSFQTPDAPTVGQDLEAEFNKLDQVLDETQARLAEIQRDDGRLGNLSVHPDALSAEVRALLTITGGQIKGAWAPITVYDQGDVVSNSGATYIAASAHTSGVDFDTDLAGGLWLAVSDAPVYDAALRAELASTAGSGMVGYTAGGTGAIAQTLNDRFRQRVSLADFGAALDGVTNDATAFTNAVARAVALGLGRVHIPAGTLLLSSAVDAQGLILECDGTTIEGEIENHAGIIGGKVKGFRQELLQNHPVESSTNSPKLVYRQNANRYLVMSRKPGRRGAGVIVELIKGVTTSNNSLGVDQEFLRCGWVYNCTGIYGYRKTPDSTTGTWSNYNVSASLLGHASDNQMRQATANEGTVGSTITWNVAVGLDGKVNVAVVGATSSRTFNIEVDGVVYGSYNANDWDGSIRVIELNVAPGARAIKVVHTDAAGQLRVLGVNFAPIGEHVAGSVVDEWAAYREDSFRYYVENQGSHDYAIFEKNANLWGGSYHGGETLIAGYALIDGVETPLSALLDGVLACYGEFALRQQTLIDWTGSGGGTLTVDSLTTFRDAQVRLDLTMTPGNGLVVDRFYTTMHGAHVDHTSIVFPVQQALVYDGTPVLCGQTSKIVLERRGSNRQFHTVLDFTLFADHEGIYGGARVEPENGSYAKIYYGPVVKGGRPLSSAISATTIKTFR